jgi:hypothetical protein
LVLQSPNLAAAERIRRRQAAELRDFGWHVVAYVVVNVLLFAQDWISGDGITWAYWIAIPWGAGLLFHAIAIIMGRRDETSGE